MLQSIKAIILLCTIVFIVIFECNSYMTSVTPFDMKIQKRCFYASKGPLFASKERTPFAGFGQYIEDPGPSNPNEFSIQPIETDFFGEFREKSKAKSKVKSKLDSKSKEIIDHLLRYDVST